MAKLRHGNVDGAKGAKGAICSAVADLAQIGEVLAHR
jgi:hypothetical protein